VMQANSAGVASLLDLLGVVGEITGQVGVQYSPISVVGLGPGEICTQQPVCCTGNNYVSEIK
ncbi:hypothetical protein BS17DRAFT_716701, partial [Gyrodon lividus]